MSIHYVSATNKGRNKIIRKINEERKKLAPASEQHNALADPPTKTVSVEEVRRFVFSPGS